MTTEEHYRVVINDELQYSIWPARLVIPAGWRSAGFDGLRADCLDHIRQVWTDMRPLSVRRHLGLVRDGTDDNRQGQEHRHG
jgi:MbtH protein